MKYKTKIKINGAELTDEQSSSASSITGVSLEASAGNGFQVGNSAASALSVTILKPYKTSFDGDKVEFYILPDGEDDESLAEKLEDEVGSTEETEHVEDNDETDDIDTEEVDDGEGEEMTPEEEAEAETEDDIEESNLFDTMNGEEVTGEVTEEEAVPDPADWELFGVFYVYKQTNNRDGSITLRCYDGFQLLHGDYVPAIKSGTIQQFYDDIRTQCAELGVTVDPEEFAEEENVTITWNQVCSFRQAIGYLAGLVGGYATFGDDDTLGIDYYAYNDRVLLLPELLDYKTTSAGETQIDGVVCTVNLRGDTMESGDGGQSITFYNPFATQQTVDSILEQYQGIRYIGANVKAKWDPSVRCGDLVRVMSEAEYRNYVAMGNAFRNSGEKTATEVLNLKKELNAVGRTILVSSQRIDFGGETLTEITSYLPTESEKANAPTSPNDAKFRIVTAELIKTNELVAEKAAIKDLEATNAEIKNIKADYVNTEMLEAEAAKIAKAEIENATIKNAQIESINGNKIVNGSIVAAALSSEVIKNFANNNIYYQATEPTGDIKEGDLWFKTMTATSGDRAGVLFVWSGGAWQNKKFDSESILAKSITAGEIASGTITAGEVDMDNLQTNLARIGDPAGKNVQITGAGVEIKDGEKTLTSYGETSTIGATAGNHVTIAADGVRMDSGTAQIANFGIVKAGTKMTHIWTKELDSDRWDNLPALGYGLYYDGYFPTDYAPGTVTSLQFETTGGAKIEIPSDSSSSAFYEIDEAGGIHIVGREERPTEEFQAFDWANVWSLKAEYTTKNNTPFLSIGEKVPGKMLTISSDFENVLNIDSFGNLTVSNSIASKYGGVDCARGVVNCKSLTAEDNRRNRVSFTEITEGWSRITATTGTVTMEPQWWRCGNLVQMEFKVAAVAAVGPGKNIATGTIDGIPRPVTTTGLRAVSYYGDNANVSFVSQDGAFTVRNCGSDELAKGSDAIGIFTYITDGTFTGGSSTGGQPGGGA
jgi:hypothetical protein